MELCVGVRTLEEMIQLLLYIVSSGREHSMLNAEVTMIVQMCHDSSTTSSNATPPRPSKPP